MSEALLNALVHLFALIANVKGEALSKKGHDIVKLYLERYLNAELLEEYLNVFNNYYDFYKRELSYNPTDKPEDNMALISNQVFKVCTKVKKELLQDERVVVLVQLIDITNEDGIINKGELEFIEIVANSFSIEKNEYNDLLTFITENKPDKIAKEKVLIIDNTLREWSDTMAWMMKKGSGRQQAEFRYLYRNNLYGKIIVLHIASTASFLFRYFGEMNLYLEGHKIIPGRTYFYRKGAIIKSPHIDSIYYHDIASKFALEQQEKRIVFSANKLQYHFKNTTNGIQEFNFSEESGQLIGIMGGSGVGKSTLLSLLSGKLSPQQGKVKINNYNVHRNFDSLTGIIGFIPQDDLLFEELTVFQNLYYNAKLCFSEYNEQQITDKVNQVLKDLDLNEISDLRVGDP